MTTTSTLSDLFRMFPGADPHWGARGIDIAWTDGHIIVTDEAEGEWMIGVYLYGKWMQGDAPDVLVVINGEANMVTFVDDLTELQPEGTDWGAWAVQWIADAMADRRIAGLV